MICWGHINGVSPVSTPVGNDLKHTIRGRGSCVRVTLPPWAPAGAHGGSVGDWTAQAQMKRAVEQRDLGKGAERDDRAHVDVRRREAHCSRLSGRESGDHLRQSRVRGCSEVAVCPHGVVSCFIRQTHGGKDRPATGQDLSGSRFRAGIGHRSGGDDHPSSLPNALTTFVGDGTRTRLDDSWRRGVQGTCQGIVSPSRLRSRWTP